ncbi:MAG: ABC transporter permease [Culicoidibacterales bacterium]
MNIFDQVRIYLIREKKKNIILFFIMFFLCNTIAVSLLIRNANNQVIEKIQNSLNTQVTIEISQKLAEKEKIASEDAVQLTSEVLEQIGKHPMVSYFDYNQYTTVNPGGEIKVYRYEQTGESGDDSKSIFNMKGIHNNNVLDVQTKAIKLTEGRVFTEQEVKNSNPVVLISKEVANLNNLIVGDNLVVKNNIYDVSAQKDENDRRTDALPIFLFGTVSNLEIIGIYESNKIESVDERADSIDAKKPKEDEDVRIGKEREYYLNHIYVPNGIVNEILEFKEKSRDDADKYVARYDNIYYLANTDDLETFKQDITESLPVYYKVYTAEDMYANISSSISSTESFSYIIFTTSLLFSTIILIFVCGYFIRNRSNEMAIYLSLGMKKFRILIRILLEVSCIAAVVIIFTVSSSFFIAEKISNVFIINQLEQDLSNRGGAGSEVIITRSFDNSNINLTVEDDYLVEIDWLFIVTLSTSYLVVVLIGTTLSCYQIIRLKPKDVFLS